MEISISKSALGGTHDSLTLAPMGGARGSATASLPRAASAARRASRANVRKVAAAAPAAAKSVQAAYRPRFWGHVALVSVAAGLVLAGNPSNAHNLSVRLMSSAAGTVKPLDETATAQVAAEIATRSRLMVTTDAEKTATAKTQQVAMLTAAEDTLAKRQVASTAGNPTRDVTTYAVQPGDTLTALADKFNVTSSTIKWANDIEDADAIAPGQNLTILPVSGVLYTVAQGDTPEVLAGKFSANAAQISSYNNAEADGLKPGEKIIIPDGVKPEPPKPVVRIAAAQAATPRSGTVAGASTAAATQESAPVITNFSGGGNSYARGYCTWYVANRRSVPAFWGNANTWLYNAQAAGFGTGSVPVPGAIAWTGAGYYGHVAYVEAVSGSMVTISEMNFNGNWNRVTSRTVPASSFKYIY